MNKTIRAFSPQRRREMELLTQHVSGHSRSYLYAHPEFELSPHQRHLLRKLQHRLNAGEPLAYLLGQQGFRRLTLKVTPAVLIPRPETEALVDVALELLGGSQRATAQVLDLGTGCGAIALALASECPACDVLATDNSRAALALATENSEDIETAVGSTVVFLLSDWYQSVAGNFDLILANPPYVDENDRHLEKSVTQYEPQPAVISAAGGLADIQRIIKGAPQHLHSQGWLLLEHGWQQGSQVRALLVSAGFQRVATITDLAGHERISKGQLE